MYAHRLVLRDELLRLLQERSTSLRSLHSSEEPSYLAVTGDEAYELDRVHSIRVSLTTADEVLDSDDDVLRRFFTVRLERCGDVLRVPAADDALLEHLSVVTQDAQTSCTPRVETDEDH